MNNNNPKYFFFSLLLTTVFFFACEEPTTPVSQKNINNYTWTKDTLNIPDAYQNLMRSMYAANADDIYLVGHNDGSPMNDGNGDAWHYDGENWSIIRWHQKLGGFFPYSIHGSSPNNIWVVGSQFVTNSDSKESFIAHFDGIQWKECLSKTPNGVFDAPISKNAIFSVYVESETEVWACGDGGLVYHYDDNNWDIDTLNIPLAKNKNRFELVKIVGNNNNKYILSNYSESWDAKTHYYIFHYKDNQWAVIDSFAERPYYHPFGITDLYYSSFDELYTVGPEVYKRLNNWETITLDHYTWIWGISDYGKDNMIAVGTYRAFHYNGSDWSEIKALTDESISYQCVWMDSKNVFVVGNTTINNTGKTIVWHGK